MKQQLLLLLGSIGLLLGVPLAAVAGLSEPLSSLDKSPIVEEFGFLQVKLSTDSIEQMGEEEASVQVVGYRPVDTNYHNKVVLIVRMDSANNIVSMNLVLSTTMIKDTTQYWYAARLTNAFFNSTLGKEATEPFRPLLAQILYPRLLRIALPAQKPERLPDFPTSDYLTFIGKLQIFARTYGSISMVMETVRQEEGGQMISILLQHPS
jgi:hypothetical protein